MPGFDFFGASPFMGGFFTARPNNKWPVAMGPPPYGIWPATVAARPGVDPPDGEEWTVAEAEYGKVRMSGPSWPMRCVNVVR